MSAELESLRELPPQPNQDAAVRLTDDQLENWIVAFGEWQFVLACEAVKRSLPGKRGFKSLYAYLADHLKIPSGTASDLAQRVSVALELTSDSGTSVATEVDNALTQQDVRELNRNPAAREEIKKRIKEGEEPKAAVAKTRMAPRAQEPQSANLLISQFMSEMDELLSRYTQIEVRMIDPQRLPAIIDFAARLDANLHSIITQLEHIRKEATDAHEHHV